jgi:hypothetical protein
MAFAPSRTDFDNMTVSDNNACAAMTNLLQSTLCQIYSRYTNYERQPHGEMVHAFPMAITRVQLEI